MARRLLADDDPRVRKALRDVLYGGRSRLDVQRLIRLSDAFSAYTTDGLADQRQQQLPAATSSRGSNGSRNSREPVLSPAAKDALLAVFNKKGSYVQQLLVDELVAAADAMSREALSETLRLVLGSAPAAVALSSLEALGPLRPLLVPFATPLELLSRLAPVVALTAEDEEALGVVRGIFELVARMAPDAAAATASSAAAAGSSGYSPVGAADAGNAASGMVFSTTGVGRLSGAPGFGGLTTRPVNPRAAVAAAAEAVTDAANIARELQPILPELLPGLQYTGELFVRAFLRRVALRFAKSMSVDQYGSSASVDDEERALAMAALGFVAGPDSFNRIGSIGLPAGFNSNNSTSGFGYGGGFLSQLQQGRGRAGAGPAAFGPQPLQFTATNGQYHTGDDAASAAAHGVGGSLFNNVPLTAGQLVTGLVAAPLLAVLTPLAILNDMQRKQHGRQ